MNPISSHDPQQVDVINRIATLAADMNSENRQIAERVIKEYQQSLDQQSGFAPLLLQVSSSGLPSAPFASIVFKNTIKMSWNPGTAEHCLQDEDKDIIRNTIIRHTINSELPVVQRNLEEAIVFVAKLDFPSRWSTPLDTLLEVFSSPFSVPLHSTALSIAHSILIRYRDVKEGEGFVRELQVINQSFLVPFLNVALIPLAQVLEPSQTGFMEVLKRKALEGVIAGVECLVDLSQLDVGDEFLDSIEKIVKFLLQCLSLPFFNPLVIDLKSVVVQCVKHFLLCFDEDFEKYAGQFLKVVWDLIADPASRDPSLDNLVVCGLDLLSSACQSTTRGLFDTKETITLLLNQVAMPNLSLTEEEIDLFEHEPDMYMQRDIQGSDFHTRRSAASSIIRQIVLYFSDHACPILMEGVEQLLSVAARDWHAKDTAIFLSSSLLVDGRRADAQRGANIEAMGTLIQFEMLLYGIILPELNSEVSKHSPLIIKADALRFIATFCARLDSNSCIPSLLPVLIAWIRSENLIVSSYAAHAFRKMLLLTTSSSPISGTSSPSSTTSPTAHVLTDAMLEPHAEQLLGSLCEKIRKFGAVSHPYSAQCVLQVIQGHPNIAAPFLMEVVQVLNAVLTEVVKNPSHPLFSHCLFDIVSRSISILQRASEDNSTKGESAGISTQRTNSCQAIEDLLIPNFTFILANAVVEYMPYTLQILAQLLDRHTTGSSGGVPPAFFQTLLPPLFSPELLQHRGSLPAVVRLLISYVERFPEWLHHTGATDKLLLTVRHLIQLKNYDHEGLSLLTSMMLSYPRPLLQPHWTSIFQALLQRLQVAKTPKYIRIFLIFLSISVVVCGATEVVQVFESIQAGLFMMVLSKVWLTNLQKVTGCLERKVCVVALVTLFCDCPFLQSSVEAWSSCVFRCWSLLYREAEQDDHTSFIPAVAMTEAAFSSFPSTQRAAPSARSVSWVGADGSESGGAFNNNIYCALEAAQHSPIDVCQNVVNPVTYFRDKLCVFLRGPGVALQAALPHEVLGLLNSA